MRIVTFTAIAVALITPFGSANMGYGRGQVDGGSIIDTFASQSAEVYGRGQVDAAGSVQLSSSDSADVYGRGQVDGAESVALFYPSDIKYGRGQIDAAGSIAFSSSDSADVYGRGQIDASSSIALASSDSADVYGRGQIDAAESVELFNSSNLGYGRGQVDAAGSVELFNSSSLGYGRGQVDAAGSVQLFSLDSAEVYGRGQVDAAESVSLVISNSQSADVYGRGQVDAAESVSLVISNSQSADVYGRGQVDAAKSGLSAVFAFASNGDTNDLLNFIGKNYDNAGTWANPHTAGRVTVSYSSNAGLGTALTNLVDRATNAVNFTNPVASSFFQVDFGAGKLIAASTYSIRAAAQSGYYLRTWKLRGSNDGTSWTDLDTRTADTAIAADNGWGTWTVSGAAAYQYLRVEQTGLNSTGTNHFVFAEFQVYGTFTY